MQKIKTFGFKPEWNWCLLFDYYWCNIQRSVTSCDKLVESIAFHPGDIFASQASEKTLSSEDSLRVKAEISIAH